MSDAAELAPLPSAGPALRQLFLLLFLRGRGARGLQQSNAPTSIAARLALTLALYGLIGCSAFLLGGQPVFALSLYLHATTFFFIGTFIAASSGEILFNKEEADILLHRPVLPGELLWAKVSVLVKVSLWLAGAFNLAGLFVGATMTSGGWRFPLVHALSTVLEALFCAGSVVLVYQLCLRWFGRERLDGLMTMAQVLMVLITVIGYQVMPHLITRMDKLGTPALDAWWVALLPPAWFASIDDALAGLGTSTSWTLAGAGFGATAIVLWLSFGRLAGEYELAMQTMGETASRRARDGRRRWIAVLVKVPPLGWWLRDPVERASFLLTTAYLVRDRDVKLRVYPGLVPLLIIPFISLLGHHGERAGGSGLSVGFAFALASVYVGLVPYYALELVAFSSQWQASDVFRVAPMAGPGPLCDGARKAVLFVFALPLVLVCTVGAWMTQTDPSQMLFLLPGLIALPVFGIIPAAGGRAVPLSHAGEEAKGAGRGITIFAVLITSFVVAGLAVIAQTRGWYAWFLAAEVAVAVWVFVKVRRSVASARWGSAE